MGTGQGRHEIGRGREVGPVARLGGGDAERDREMGFADTRRSDAPTGLDVSTEYLRIDTLVTNI